MLDSAALAARLNGVRAKIARAASRAGRDPASVRLIAVSKTFSSDHVRAAASCGQLDFGENKVQEAQQKIEVTRDLGLIWHLIGHLQSNKARKAGTLFDCVHSIDDPRLVGIVDQAASQAGRTVDLLIQVDLAGEATKHGLRPDELMPVVDAADHCRSARLAGLMLLPPASQDPEQARPFFAALRRLRDELIDRGVPSSRLTELSMGMSHDFEIAVEEGATMVRVGSAIFGARPSRAEPQ